MRNLKIALCFIVVMVFSPFIIIGFICGSILSMIARAFLLGYHTGQEVAKDIFLGIKYWRE